MQRQYELQPAYVLHQRAYRETSLIVDFLTEDQGRIAAVMRGPRGKRQRLQLFTPLLIACKGRGELKTLIGMELSDSPHPLGGAALYCAMYINELLMRVLPVADPQPAVFHLYAQTLLFLRDNHLLEPLLRRFEFSLLQQLGYGLPLDYDAESGDPIEASAFYRYEAEHGFVCCEQAPENIDAGVYFFGEHLLKIRCVEYDSEPVRRAAKRLARLALYPLLGDKPLKSREFFTRF
jgi:DNA repair protein RecO (recombination protein O)